MQLLTLLTVLPYTYTKPSEIKNHYLNNIEINPRFSFNWDINGDQSAVSCVVVAVPLPAVYLLHGLVMRFITMVYTYGAYDKNNITATGNGAITPGTNPTQAPSKRWFRFC
jgi:hypothetical protein